MNGDDDVVSVYDPLNRKVQDTFVAVEHFDDLSGIPITAAAWMSYAYNDAGELTASTDRLQRTTNREYDALGRLTKVIQPAVAAGTPTTLMQYDAVGNLRLVYDPLQSQALLATNRTEYEYDALDRRTVVRGPAPDIAQATVRPVVTTGYDHVGNVRTVTDPRQQLTSTDYNKQNLPTLVMQPDPGPGPGGTAADHPPVLTAFTYDPAGNRIAERASSTRQTLLGQVVLMDYTTSTQFDNLDRPYKVTDRTNLVTETSYFADGLVESMTQASGTPDSRTTKYGYDGLGRTRLVSRQRLLSVYDVTTTTYDAVGNLVEITDPIFNKTTFTYDAAYRKIGEKTFAYTTSTTNRPEVTRAYQYDRQNNFRLVTDRNGRQTRYDYDGLDRRTTETWLGTTGNGYVASFVYDLAGNLKSAADAYGTTPYTSVGYNLDGMYRTKTVTTKLPGVAPTAVPARFDSEVGYSYDLSNNRVSSSVSVYSPTENKLVRQLTTAFVFDNLNRTLSIRQHGPTIFGRAVNFDYHADGRVKEVTRWSGSLVGRMLGATPMDTSLMGKSVSVFHATTGRLESLTHNDNKGNAEVKYTFGYDVYSRITAIPETRPQVGDVSTQPYEYDLTDQTKSQGFGFAGNGNRTGGGYITSSDNRLATDPAYVYTYDAEGNRAKREAYSVSALHNGHVQAIDDGPTPTANEGSWVSSSVGYNGGQQIGSSTTFSRATATWQTPALPAGSYAVYATWAPLTNGLTTEPFTITKTDATGASQTTTSAPMNFRLAPGGLDYDSAKWTQIGTVTSTGTETVSVTLSTGSTNSGTIPADAILFKPTGLDVARTTYEWDHQNRLTKVTNESAAFSATGVMTLSPRDTTTYAYDVLGRRAAVTYDLVGPADGGGDFRRVSVYDGSQVVWTETGTNREQMVSQGTTQAMLWAPGTDQLLAIQERLGGTGAVKQPVWTLTDHQGTVKDYLAKAPTAGAESGLLLTRRYSAFGAPLSAKQWNNVPTGGTSFTDISGKSGFFYVGQEYDATTGLQYSRARYYDPVSSEFISQDPLGFAGGDTNLYRRAGNSPANATDPSGLIINVAAGAGIGAVIGGGFYLVSNYVSGRDFNWSDFAIATASGAVSGAVAGATGGASLLAQAASGAAAGAAGGAVYGGATSYAAGGSLQQVAGNALSGAAVGTVAGLAGDAVTGRLLGASPAAAMLGQRVAANAAGGATGGAIGGGFDGYMHTGTLAGTVEGAATGLVYGGVIAGGLTAGSAAVRRAFAPVSTVVGAGFNEKGILPRNGTRTVLNQGPDPTCGPTSCGMILDDSVARLSTSITGYKGVGPKGIAIDDLLPILNNNGVKANYKSGLTIDALKAATARGNPAIVAIKTPGGGHAVVVDGITTRLGKQVVAIRNPWGTQYFQTVEEFRKVFLRQGILTGN